jgi:hypothetical protein
MTYKTLKNTEYNTRKLYTAIRCFLDIIKELKVKNISDSSVEFKEMYLLQKACSKKVFSKEDIRNDFSGFLGTALHPMLANQILIDYRI